MKKKVCTIIILSLFLSKASISQNIFQTGQKADIILGTYGTGSNAYGLNHPSSAESDGTRLFVADTRNNRILVWNTIPTTNNQPADIVIGQENFSTNTSGISASKLNWPISVSVKNDKLVVSDTENNRVLIWNQIPTESGIPADVVLGQPDFNSYERQEISASSLYWPWYVEYDGDRLYVVDSGNTRVLVWYSIPTTNNQPADLVLGRKTFKDESTPIISDWSMMSPRCVASDRENLAIVDYQWNRILIWNKPPIENGEAADCVLMQDDFTTNDEVQIGDLSFAGDDPCIYAGKLFLPSQLYVHIWNHVPTSNNPPCDQRIGYKNERHAGIWSVSYDGQHLFVSGTNGSRVLIYNEIPDDSTTMPDVVLGQNDFMTTVFEDMDGFESSTCVMSTGQKLMITEHGNNRTLIHQELPSYDEETADNFIKGLFTLDPNQVWSDGRMLMIADRHKGIHIWDNIPQENGIIYNRVICPDGNCGSVHIREPYGLTMAGDKLIYSNTWDYQILIWNSLPKGSESHDPDIILNLPFEPFGVTTDGQRLVAAGTSETFGIPVWESIPTQNDQPPDFYLYGKPLGFNGVYDVFLHDNRLFVVDTGNERVCIYNTFPTDSEQSYDVVLGQDDFIQHYPGTSRKKMRNPFRCHFDGEYLWVSEFKWADRILGFKANYEPAAPVAATEVQATAISNHEIELLWHDNATTERGYIIKYRQKNDSNYKTWSYLNSNTTFHSITDLEPNTIYQFKVISYNSYGESESIELIECTTKKDENSPPYIPSDPYPEDGYFFVPPQKFELRWSGEDPDAGDKLVYDLYFGNSQNPPLYAKNLTSPIFYDSIHNLPGDVTLYWKVVAKDKSNFTTESPVWSFIAAGAGGQEQTDLTIASCENGTTNPLPGKYFFDNRKFDWDSWRDIIGGAQAIIHALPDSEYYFTRWTGDVPDSLAFNNPLSIPLDMNRSISANYLKIITSVTINEPQTFNLNQNYPNPFNPNTTISFELPMPSNVCILIIDVLGRTVKKFNRAYHFPGRYQIEWDGSNNNGINVSSGVYFYKLIINNNTYTRKMLLLR